MNTYTTLKMSQIIRIDNCIVKRVGNSGISIGSIRMYEKENRLTLDLDEVPYVSTGLRRTDSLLMQGLISGSVSFDDLPIVYPSSPFVLK